MLRAADEDLATAVGTLMPVFSYSVAIGASGQYTVEPTIFTKAGQSDYSTGTTLKLIASMTHL